MEPITSAEASSRRPLVVVVNNRGGLIRPSETFLTAHIRGLQPPVIPLVGLPGCRFLVDEGHKSIPHQGFLSRGVRFVSRGMGFSSISLQDRKALARFLKQRNVGAVLAEYGPTAVSVLDACRGAEVPLIAHFHGFDAHKFSVLKEYASEYQQLFTYAAAIVVVSRHMMSSLIRLGAPEQKLFLNPCGAQVEQGVLAAPDRAPPQFLMVGRMVEKKAPFIAVMAFSKVLIDNPNARLLLIGEGPLLNVCEQVARVLRITGSVELLGAVAHDVVIERMRQSRCFIQHSVMAPDGDMEGTPVAVLEAMGMGLPVVATRHAGIADVIKDGQNGSLVDEYDMDGMSAAMNRFAKDPSYAALIGKRAREDILEHWSMTASIDRLQSIVSGVKDDRKLPGAYPPHLSSRSCS